MKIGIDIGGSHIGIGIVNQNGEIVEKVETDIDIESKEKNNLEEFCKDYLVENVKRLIQKYPIQMVGVASPGTPKEGKITTLVNLKIEQLEIEKILTETCNKPVLLRNDAKCAAIAEKKYGSLKKYKDCVFICLGTGIGGAVFMNDKLLVPSRNPGFELGHMVIEKEGKLCNCGKRGCFETYCSMKRLKGELIDLLDLPKNTSGAELLEELKRCQQENSMQTKSKSSLIEKSIENYIDNLIIGLSNIIDIFEPEAICLGGSFVHFEDILYQKLIDKYYTKRYVFNKQKMPDLKLATLGNDAGIIGATRQE